MRSEEQETKARIHTSASTPESLWAGDPDMGQAVAGRTGRACVLERTGKAQMSGFDAVFGKPRIRGYNLHMPEQMDKKRTRNGYRPKWAFAAIACATAVLVGTCAIVGIQGPAFSGSSAQESMDSPAREGDLDALPDESSVDEDYSADTLSEDGASASIGEGEHASSRTEAPYAEKASDDDAASLKGIDAGAPIAPPGEGETPSLYSLLKTALQPVGSTMYVYWGGWTEPHGQAADELVTIGMSDRWAEYASWQDDEYVPSTEDVDPRDGLNCTGFVAWAIYNTLQTEDYANDGYASIAVDMAFNLADEGLGSYFGQGEAGDWRPGDIVSLEKHVFLVIGQCEDGSVVFVHSSPPGVALAGTLLPNGSFSQATALATWYMFRYYSNWHERYYVCWRPYSYLSDSSVMRWSRDVLHDDERLAGMDAEEVLEVLFADVEPSD